ncbi:biopolymer transporter ExbD [Myxococcota bacterium]|nr:biopolymer transporter ExbD [Myxococcota bacterium]
MQAGPPTEHSGDEEDEGGFFAEINITPLTDVFLVLLIILMVVSSSVIEDEKEEAYQKGLLAERALQVMTPEGAGNEDLVPEDVVISVLPDRTVYVENEEVPRSALDARLSAIAAEKPGVRIILRADKTASYDVVMDILARCSKNGLGNVALASRD